MESWPVTEPELELSQSDVSRNLESVRKLMTSEGIEALLITSSDRFLNEYTPRHDNHRFHLSGFTGSTAFLLIPEQGRARLYVDGRYHIQADQEVDPSLVRVVKVSMGAQLFSTLLDDIGDVAVLGYEPDRVSGRHANQLRSRAKSVEPLPGGALATALQVEPIAHIKPIEFIPESISGRTVPEKLSAVFKHLEQPKKTALLLGALDDIAWLSEGRAYHFPYQSSFAAVGVATSDCVHVVVEEGLLPDGAVPEGVFFHEGELSDLLAAQAFDSIKAISFDPGNTTDGLVRQVSMARPKWELSSEPSPVVRERALKTHAELDHFRSMNRRASRSITGTISWVRRQIAEGETVTESSFHEKANQCYAAEGARDLSFHTISGVGSNSAIIHYAKADEKVIAGRDDLMLLDSGGLYEGGFCTDTTRTFIAGGVLAQPTEEQKRNYTLVLKGLIGAMTAVFPRGTRGAFLDALARAPLYSAGLDYSHGTGHGVGIHVHEPGVGIGPQASGIIEPGMVCSIEPGYYREGWGGIRIENVVVFREHPTLDGFLTPEPLNYVGFDAHLVDESLFTKAEKAAYNNYQSICAGHGTLEMG